MRVVITGVSGSGGSYLAEFIRNRFGDEIEIWGTSRWRSTTPSDNNKQKLSKFCKVVECDLTDLSSTLKFLKAAKPNLIFHLASHANVRAAYETPLSVFSNNVHSTHNLLEALRLLDLFPKFIMCSTSEVYGQIEQDQVPVKESHPLKPRSPYAASKASQEMLCSYYFESYGLPVIITRMFTYINPRRVDLFATSFANQIALIEMRKQETLRHGNLESVRTLIDIRDAMECYWRVSEVGVPGEAYNLGGSFVASVGEVLQIMIRKSSVEIKTELDQFLLRPADATLQIPDCTKFFQVSKWKPKYDIEESLEFLMKEVRSGVSNV